MCSSVSMQEEGSSSHAQGQQQHQEQLPPALQLYVLSFLPPNDRALSGRLVSPDAAAGLSEPHNSTASLSQSLPPHAVPWAMEAGQQHMRQLPFWHKLQPLCTAAASGSEVNLEVALALYQLSSFPEFLHQVHQWRSYPAYLNPGVIAVRAGHLQLLGWLLRHCPALLMEKDHRRAILSTAAQHCDLAGLQAVWAALGCGGAGAYPPLMDEALLAAVAASPIDAEAKMEWVLAEGRGSCSLQKSTATAAVRSGDLGRLRWLRERGCPMDLSTLEFALQHADLAVADWLVDEAECELPEAAGEEGRWAIILDAAARSPDGVPRLQWLRARGAPPLGGDSGVVKQLLRSAAEAGRVEVVRHLLSGLEPAAALSAAQSAVRSVFESGSIPTVEALIQAGATLDQQAYNWSIAHGGLDRDYGLDCASGYNVAMVRWLAREARVSAAELDLPEFICLWPNDMPAHSRGLLEAVQALLDEAGCRDWDAKEALTAGAWRGDLALVQYLQQQTPEYRPDWKVLVAVTDGGCEALLEWLVMEHPSCLPQPEECSLYASAAANDDLGTLTALQRLGVPWGPGDVVAKAVRVGCSATAVRWLVEQGAPLGSRKAMEAALDSGDAIATSAEVGAWLLSLVVAEAEAEAAAR